MACDSAPDSTSVADTSSRRRRERARRAILPRSTARRGTGTNRRVGASGSGLPATRGRPSRVQLPAWPSPAVVQAPQRHQTNWGSLAHYSNRSDRSVRNRASSHLRTARSSAPVGAASERAARLTSRSLPPTEWSSCRPASERARRVSSWTGGSRRHDASARWSRWIPQEWCSCVAGATRRCPSCSARGGNHSHHHAWPHSTRNPPGGSWFSSTADERTSLRGWCRSVTLRGRGRSRTIRATPPLVRVRPHAPPRMTSTRRTTRGSERTPGHRALPHEHGFHAAAVMQRTSYRERVATVGTSALGSWNHRRHLPPRTATPRMAQPEPVAELPIKRGVSTLRRLTRDGVLNALQSPTSSVSSHRPSSTTPGAKSPATSSVVARSSYRRNRTAPARDTRAPRPPSPHLVGQGEARIGMRYNEWLEPARAHSGP